MKPKEQLRKLAEEDFDITISWTCPLCDSAIELYPETPSKKDLAHALYEEGVRHVESGTVNGMVVDNIALCSTCHDLVVTE
jgi:hypothetical protein